MWRAAAAPSIGLVVHRSKFYAGLVARMERSVIRGQPIPDYAEFIIGPAEGGSRWLHPGYKAASDPNAMLIF
jgi:hypothetical protein